MFEPRNKVWIGLRRQGKTLAMVGELIKSLKVGTPVYSNIIIHVETKTKCYFSYYLETGEDFKKAMLKKHNCIFAVDEIGLVFPNQYWNRMDMRLLALFKQSGHVGVSFYGTTHTIADVTGKLRDVVDDVILCKKKRGIFGLTKLPVVKSWKKVLVFIFSLRWHKLFGENKLSLMGRPYHINEAFRSIPAYVFSQTGVKKSYKGTGGWRQYMNNLLWQRDIYPSTYVQWMQAYNTKQMVDHNVMVQGNQSVSRKYQKDLTTKTMLQEALSKRGGVVVSNVPN